MQRLKHSSISIKTIVLLQAVRLTCELCLCYGVGSGDLWTCMLERLLELAMVWNHFTYLEGSVRFVGGGASGRIGEGVFFIFNL